MEMDIIFGESVMDMDIPQLDAASTRGKVDVGKDAEHGKDDVGVMIVRWMIRSFLLPMYLTM